VFVAWHGNACKVKKIQAYILATKSILIVKWFLNLDFMKVRIKNVCLFSTFFRTIIIVSSTSLKYSKYIFFKMALEANYHGHENNQNYMIS
jgi:hypothetical protein